MWTSPYATLYNFIASARNLIVSPQRYYGKTNNSELRLVVTGEMSGVFIPGAGTVTFVERLTNQIQTIWKYCKTNETIILTNNTGGARGGVVDAFELTVLEAIYRY
jgi:hypothetical protein